MKPVLVLNSDTTFIDLIKKVNDCGQGFVAVIDKNQRLIGIVTDGDIRRAILNGVEQIKDAINTKPEVAMINTPRNVIVNRLRSLHRRHMPVVDNKLRYQGVVTLDEIEFHRRPNCVVIMAGGLGSRLGDITKYTPKPMLPVGDKPLLENQIGILSNHGFGHFIVSVNYRAEVIQNYLGDGSTLGVSIEYIKEEIPLGTAGSLSLLQKKIMESVIVLNGDVLTTLDFSDLVQFHESSGSSATMGVREYTHKVPYGVVEQNDGKITGLKEKPTHSHWVNAGVYVLSKDAVDQVPKGKKFDMTDLFNQLIDAGKKTTTYPINDYWIDIGHPHDLEKARTDLTFF